MTKWQNVQLDEICNPKQWPTISQTDFTHDGYPVYGANGRIGYYSEYNHAEPTILITCRGATCGTVNVCEPKSYVTGNSMALDDLDKSRVHMPFLVHALRFQGLKRSITGTAQPQITRQSLTAISIPLPPLTDQRQISNILDEADALRRKRAEAIRLANDLVPSLFHEMFGDTITNPMKWREDKLGQISEVQGGLQLSAARNTIALQIPYLRVANVYRDRLWLDEVKTIGLTENELTRTRLMKDDILVVEGHGNPEEIGRTAIWDGSIDPCVHQNHLIRVRADRKQVHPVYLNVFLNSPAGRRQLTGYGKTTSGLNTINVSNVRNTRVLIPDQNVQDRFVSALECVRATIVRQQESSTELDNLFHSLLQRAFRGEL